MNLLKLLPDRTLYLINKFAGVKFSTALLEDIKYKIVDRKLDCFKNKVEDQFMLYRNFVDDISFEEYIHTMLTREKKDEYLHFFQNCECCARHTYTGKIRNREKLHNLVYMDHSDHPTLRCTCPCRHFRRFIVRSNMPVFN